MPEPGYYKTDYKAVTLRELVRMKGLLKLPITFILTRFVMRPTGGVWMPETCRDLACGPEDLSALFWAATEVQRNAIQNLGFTLCQLSKLKRNLNPLYLDNGGATYLHSDRRYVATLVFGQVKSRQVIAVGFSAAFERGGISFVNTKKQFDPLPHRESVFVGSDDPAAIYARFISHLQREPRKLRVFANCSEACRWLDEARVEAFEARVKRGLFVRMTDDEVSNAEQAMRTSTSRRG